MNPLPTGLFVNVYILFTDKENINNIYIALVQKYTMPKLECLFYIQMYLIKCQRLNISAKRVLCRQLSIQKTE